jgi:type IV secretory pathway VirJ component
MHPLSNKKLAYSILIISLVLIGVTAFIFHHFRKPPVVEAVEKIFDEKIQLANRQTIRLVHAQEPEKGLLIYIADGHSSKLTSDYAKKFAGLSYYVAVIDSQAILKSTNTPANSCENIAENIITISKQLQTTYDIDDDELPILVGNNEGAAIVYTALAQAGKDYFHAGISINFTPQIATHIPLCELNNFTTTKNGNNTNVAAIKHLPTSWYIFQDMDTNQNAITKAFTYKVSNAKLTIANEPNETSLTQAIQILQWLDPRLSDQISSDTSDGDLPLIEVAAEPNNQTTMAIILTGDGGWAEIDKSVARILAEKGIPTVALDSLSYFWRSRTPEETAKDIEDTIAQYREKWGKQDVILIGYSFGADVLPFVANKLSTDTQKSIALIALLGMGKTAAFKFHLSSWINADKDPSRRPILPELKNMSWANSICIYGVDDPESNCTETASLGVKVISMTGDHHFDEKYDELVQHIIDSSKHSDIKNK